MVDSSKKIRLTIIMLDLRFYITQMTDDQSNLSPVVQWRSLIWKHRPNLVYWIFLIFDSVNVMS
jgi:hypothetical protein